MDGENQGIGDSIVTTWTDRILVSTDAILGDADDITLGEFNRTGILNPGETYSRDELVTIPFNLVGDYQLYVVTDAANRVYEASNENNNAGTVLPLTINRQTPDLTVTQITAPTTAQSGTTITINWTVKNFGLGGTNSNYWYDQVYLSTDSTLSGNDISLGAVFHSGSLNAAGEYTGLRTFNLPIDLNGTYYVIVQADSDNLVVEGAGENNNYLAATTATTINLSPVPDFVIQSVDAPASAITGQLFNLTWTVTNNGAATTGSWYDGFYLSRDQIFDRNSDIFLGYTAHNSLGSGASYTKTTSFNLPRGLTGRFYVFAVTDSSNQIYERSGETNNIGFDAFSLEVILPPPSDLIVTNITVPANGIPGEAINISYTITNQGTDAAIGSWYDAVYISADTQWDIGDTLVGQVFHTGDVDGGASYSGVLQATLPGITPGNYYAIVRSDIRNQVPEVNQTNNTGVSANQITIDAEVLTLGVADTATLSQGQSIYYRFNATAGQTIRLRLDSQDNQSFNELYVQRGVMPNRGQFDLTTPEPFTTDPEIIIPIEQTGTYYVLAYGDTVTGSPAYTITAEEIPFSITAIKNNQVGNTGLVTLDIQGAQFSQDTVFNLIDAAGNSIAARQFLLENSSRAYVTFNLDEQLLGLYDLQATKGNNQTVILNDSLTVIADNADNINVQIDGPDSVRPGRNYLFNINYGNNGGADSIAPLILLESATNTPVGLSLDDFSNSGVLQLLGTSEGFTNSLHPGELGNIPVYFQSSTNPINFNVRAIAANSLEAADWDLVRNSARPEDISLAQWNTFFTRIQPRIGETWGDYVQFINQLSLRYSPSGEPIQDVQELFSRLYQDNPNILPTSIFSGQLLNSATGEAFTGVQIAAYQLVNGELILGGSTVTDAQGNFSINGLDPGEYQLAIATDLFADTNNIAFDNNQDGVADESAPIYTINPSTDLGGVQVYALQEQIQPETAQDTKPSFITDSSGTPHLFWSRNGEIWHAYFDGTNWIDAAPIPGANSKDFSVQAANNLIDGSGSGLIVSWSNGDDLNQSEIYYAIARPQQAGGYQWSEPVAITNDAIADSRPTVVVTNQGQGLVVYQKSDDSIQDDTDLYYNLFDVDSQSLSWTSPLSLEDLLTTLDASPGAQTFSLGWKFDGTPKWAFLQKLAQFKTELRANGSYDVACELRLQADGTAQIEFSSRFAKKTKAQGQLYYKGEWTAKGTEDNCYYEFKKASLGFNVGIGADYEMQIEELVSRIPNPAIGLPATLLLVALRQLGIFEANLGVSVLVQLGGNVQWTKPSAPPIEYRWPDTGAITYDARVGLYGKAKLLKYEAKAYGNVGAKGDILPNPSLKEVYGQLGIDFRTPSGFLFRYVYTPTLLGPNSTDLLPFADGTDDSGLPADVSIEFLYDPASFVGTGNTYFDDNNASVLANVASDLYADEPPSIATGPNGEMMMAWAKEFDPTSAQKGSAIFVSTLNGTQWNAPVQIPDSLNLSNNPVITFDGNGNPLVVWSMADGSNITPNSTEAEYVAAITETDVVYSVYTNNAWSSPVAINPAVGPDETPTLGLGANGQVLLVWSHIIADMENLKASFWDGTSWSTAQTIVTGEIIDKATIGQINGKTVVYWSEDTDSNLERVNATVFYSIYDNGWSTAIAFNPEQAAIQSSGTLNVNGDSATFTPSSFTLPTPPEECCECKEGDPDCDDDDDYDPPVVVPRDPNDILGPKGFGAENWINAQAALPYTIRFENAADASAPAQVVVITQQLDPDLDFRTFRVDDFGWGNLRFELPGNRPFFSDRIDLTEDYGIYVDVSVAIDVITGLATWRIASVDPATGEAPLDAQAGFLPVNNADGAGEGFVSYTVRTKRAIETGDVIDAAAQIVFDTEAPIDTPPIFNTIDVGIPTSSVASLPEISETPEFLVRWSGSDESNGSALAGFTIYVSENGGEFTSWLENTTLTEATYIGQPGSTYAFYAVATDNAGNQEAVPTNADATTRIAGGTTAIG
ncbi:CARDB domain-containing protein, partial [Nostoc sp. CMAA1605]|uniref:CARDB domain-containing protein n=1 Tax=Nostoc sp. CMAA1605 TaxID=2055159 RepID=UPI001F3D0FEA